MVFGQAATATHYGTVNGILGLVCIFSLAQVGKAQQTDARFVMRLGFTPRHSPAPYKRPVHGLLHAAFYRPTLE
jgi:hypothetical protein